MRTAVGLNTAKVEKRKEVIFIFKDGGCIQITILNGLSQRWHVAINNHQTIIKASIHSRTSFWTDHWDWEAPMPPCGYDGWKASKTLANDKSSHDLKHGIYTIKCKAPLSWNTASLEDRRNEFSSTPSRWSTLELRTDSHLTLLYSTYPNPPTYSTNKTNTLFK